VERTQWEFRGFVSNGKLTAITQYFSVCYFEELARDQAAICAKLVQYHERIKQRIQPHLASYGIDFFIASDGSVVTIELNPFYTRCPPPPPLPHFVRVRWCRRWRHQRLSCFGCSLGAGLFDWKVRDCARTV